MPGAIILNTWNAAQVPLLPPAHYNLSRTLITFNENLWSWNVTWHCFRWL